MLLVYYNYADITRRCYAHPELFNMCEGTIFCLITIKNASQISFGNFVNHKRKRGKIHG